MKLHLKIAVLSPYIEAATAGPSYPNVFYNCEHFISNWRVIKYDIDKKKRVFQTLLLRTLNVMSLKTTLGGDDWNVALMDWPPSWNDLLLVIIVLFLPDPFKIMHDFVYGIRTFSLHNFSDI
jgi:hypothetical protein